MNIFSNSIPKNASTGKFISSENIDNSNFLNPSAGLQIIGTNSKSYSVWSSLLNYPSHFDKQLISSGYVSNSSKITDCIDPNAVTIILSDTSYTQELLTQDDHISCVSNTLALVSELDVDFDNLSILGIQKHLCDIERYTNYTNSMYNILRLSDIRHDGGLSEVVLRESDRVVFDLNAIRKSDIPGDNSSSFCGLLIEEACQLMKYIGSIDKLKTLEICGIDFNQKYESSYYQLIALLIWYMMEGTTFQQSENSISLKKQYVIYPEGSESPLYFYNESITDKWWMNTNDDMNDLIPCSPMDYQNARNGIISERIMKIVEKV